MQTVLSDDQVAAFDKELVTDDLWPPIRQCIDRDFPNGQFSFLDIGGGNGLFTDRVLLAYPQSVGTVLELNGPMILKNRQNERKRLVEGDALALDLLPGKFDLIFCNWLLHHLVARSYVGTHRNIDELLVATKDKLTARGRLSVYENAYDGYIDSAPSRLIFGLTSIRAIAPLIKGLGANTAGVGVCFLSDKQWTRKLANIGEFERSHGPAWPMPYRIKVCLLLDVVRCVHYWIHPRSDSTRM